MQLNRSKCGRFVRTAFLVALVTSRAGDVYAENASVRDRVIENIAFPEGGLVVWTAYLDNVLRQDTEWRHPRILLDVGFPTFSNTTVHADSAFVARIASNAISRLAGTLEDGRKHPPLQIRYASLGTVLGMFEAIFECQVAYGKDNICIKAFPAQLDLREFRLEHPYHSEQGNILVTAYGGDGSNLVRGSIIDIPAELVAYVLAPPDAHEVAAKELEEFHAHGIPTPQHVQCVVGN